ncbi:MAG: iron uptake system protein EfeO [Streptococcus sp.]|nr:iron uptake system protein EfeO [Streptococcus sp.]
MRKKVVSFILCGLLVSTVLLTACSNQTVNKTENSTSHSISASQSKQLKEITKSYRDYVEKQIDKLLTDTEKWQETLKSGDLETAKKQYPLLRMSYESSEPIAESFGELDIKIDYRLVDYIDENKTEDGWTGFHRIEKILWEQNTTDGTDVYASQLVKDIKELKAKVLTVDVTADLMVTGAVDLLNEVATSKITGEEEVYSHTDLYDFRANIKGAEKIFELFKPILMSKDKALVKELETDFSEVNGLLDNYMTDSENYKLYTDLTKDDTKALANAVTKLGEPLSQMAIVTE